MTSSKLRSLPSARRIWRPSPLPQTAIPAESYPRYSSRRSPSRMTGTTRFLPTYPTIPHMPVTPAQFVGRSEPELCEKLFLNGIPEFFNHRVRQDITSDPPNFALRLRFIDATIESQFKKLALPHVLQSLIAHFLKRSLNGLSLRIENAPLQ